MKCVGNFLPYYKDRRYTQVLFLEIWINDFIFREAVGFLILLLFDPNNYSSPVVQYSPVYSTCTKINANAVFCYF